MTKKIGVLTSGGDSPGINAVIRGIGKSLSGIYQIDVIGFLDGFQGLANNETTPLEGDILSGILTAGGTILGTSRDQPYNMQVNGSQVDMTEKMLEVYRQHNLDGLVCIGGNEVQLSAFRLMEKGANTITIPKTIDNNIPETDITVGFDTALSIATDAIDRLHSTASSHHRIIIVEIMGQNAGWLTLEAGIAGGADVILIPEIPYEYHIVSEAIVERNRKGKRFSIVVVSEGALSKEDAEFFKNAQIENRKNRSGGEQEKVSQLISNIELESTGKSFHLAKRLENSTELETRVTILGHLLRGGSPSAKDRILATKLGAGCANMINNNTYGVMVASQGEAIEGVPLLKVINKNKTIPLDHSLIMSARNVGTNLGD